MQKDFQKKTNYHKLRNKSASGLYREKIVEYLTLSGDALSALSNNKEALLMVGCWIYPAEVLKYVKVFGSEEKAKRLASHTKDLLYCFSHEKMENMLEINGFIEILRHFKAYLEAENVGEEDFIKALEYLNEKN